VTFLNAAQLWLLCAIAFELIW